jgi:hypothetical protein
MKNNYKINVIIYLYKYYIFLNNNIYLFYINNKCFFIIYNLKVYIFYNTNTNTILCINLKKNLARIS